jgi:anthranilate phosphoribosyltransferase
VQVFEVTPADAGLAPARLADLKGGDAATNAQAIRDVLAGRPGPFRDIVLLNTAAALVVGGRAGSLKAGVDLAASSIASGAAARALERLVAVSNG